MPSFLKADAVKSPDIIIDYINREISVNDAENYYMTPLTPIGVHELKISDRNSRKIYFVAVCRSLGIPSRLEPGSNVPQYYFNSEWKDVYFADEKAPEARKAFLKLVSDEKNPVPEYYTHFTIARLENGHFKTLDFDYGKKITDFSEELALAPGDYMIVTGRRLASGNVLADLAFFRLAPGEHVSREIRLRNETR